MIFGSYQEVGTVTRAIGVGADVNRLIIENSMGDIRLEAGRTGLVEIFARFTAPNGEELTLKDNDVEVLAGDGKIKIKALEVPKSLRRKIHWEIRLPMALNVRARTGLGHLTANRPSHEHPLRTSAAPTTGHAQRVCGNSRFRCGTGKINVSAHRLEGEPGLLTGVGSLTLSAGTSMLTHASLKCATGNVHLNMPATYIGRVDLKAAVGRVSLGRDTGTIPVHTTIVGSRAHGLLGQGPGDIEAKTAVGNINFLRA